MLVFSRLSVTMNRYCQARMDLPCCYQVGSVAQLVPNVLFFILHFKVQWMSLVGHRKQLETKDDGVYCLTNKRLYTLKGTIVVSLKFCYRRN
jgi:hypothetical protein